MSNIVVATKEAVVAGGGGEITTTEVKNLIADSKDIEGMVVKAATDGLNATKGIYDRYGAEICREPDYGVRYKYWRDILLMKKWLGRSDINLDMRSITINEAETEILKRYDAIDV